VGNNNGPIIAMSKEELQAHWKSIVFEGILFVILGVIALSVPTLFSIAFELVIGWLFLIGGTIQLYRAIQSNKAPGFWWSVLSALLAMVFGILLVFHPLQGLIALTAIIAVYFLVEGFIKILLAISVKNFANWGWVLLSGAFSIIIAVIVFSGWPFSAMWFIGILLGVYLIVNGMAFIMIATKAHTEER
jgi:uncharacterized membrane protein HdeD (DUF308 family)